VPAGSDTQGAAGDRAQPITGPANTGLADYRADQDPGPREAKEAKWLPGKSPNGRTSGRAHDPLRPESDLECFGTGDVRS